MSEPRVKYTTVRRVKNRLAGKVFFTDDPDANPDRMPEELLLQLIEEAESDVEHDMSPRYKAPFQTPEGKNFANLPDATTGFIRALVDIKAVSRVLETDFGSGSATDGDKYAKMIEKRYNTMVDRQMKMHSNTFKQWYYPPLPGLALNFHNEAADDGFAGTVLTTSDGDGDFPGKQINDPSENFWNAEIDD